MSHDQSISANKQFVYTINVNGSDVYQLDKDRNDPTNKTIELEFTQEPLNIKLAGYLYGAPRGTRFMLLTINKYEAHTGRLLGSWLFNDCFLDETNNNINGLKIKLMYRSIVARRN